MSEIRFLLDTNILSDLIRHPAGPVARRISEVGETAVCTSIIVASELRFGAEKKQSPVLCSPKSIRCSPTLRCCRSMGTLTGVMRNCGLS
ncbi:MAG: PIN domain-containing protein [Desulfuromonadales bacterium]